MKTVGICTAGLVGGAIAPTVATVALGSVAVYTYSKTSRDKKNFITLVAAMGAAAFVSPSLLGVAAVGALGYTLYTMKENKLSSNRFSKPYDQQLIERAKKTLKMGK